MSDIRENEYIDTQILALRSKYHEIQSENQPVGNEIQIGTDRDNGAAITFSILPQTGEEEQRQVSEQMAVIRNDMKKIWKQNVFYDIGEVVAENTPVAWMDFKAYCLDGNLYSLLFMFQTQARSILGKDVETQKTYCGF